MMNEEEFDEGALTPGNERQDLGETSLAVN